MTTLNANLARPFYTQVRLEYCYDMQSHHGEFTDGLVFGVTSIPHRALGFSVLLDTGALWSHFPISAFCHDRRALHRQLPELEPWDAFGYELAVIEYQALRELSVLTLPKKEPGAYLQTIDWYDNMYSLQPDQAKQTHLIQLDDGNYGLYPGNRLLFREASFTTKLLDHNPGYLAQTSIWHAES